MKTETIEKLLNADNRVESTALKAALQDLKEKNDKVQRERLVQQLEIVQQETLNYVERVRQLRKQEKQALARLKVVAAAEEQFLKDGDYDKYVKDRHAGLLALN